MKIVRVKAADDLEAICAQIQPELWGKDNEMTAYEPVLLKDFLANGNVLVLVYEAAKIAGIATAYPMPHPSKGGSSLLVYELDTHPDFRRQGIGTVLMEELLKIAKEQGLSEVWVGADDGNE